MKIITIQPRTRPDLTQSHPFLIDEKGNVQCQDFWKGKPLALICFNSTPANEYDPAQLTLHKFLQTPNKAIGMYPVFENSTKEVFTYQEPIESVKVTKSI